MLSKIIPNWHPIFVHFTIAFFPIATVLIVSSLIINKNFKEKVLYCGYLNLWIGSLFTIFTVAAGFYAYNTVPHTNKLSHAVMTDHRNWAVITATTFFALTIWSVKLYRNNHKQNLFFIMGLIIATVFLTITGWKGSECVYRYGLGVMNLPNTDKHSRAINSAPHEHSHEHAHV